MDSPEGTFCTGTFLEGDYGVRQGGDSGERGERVSQSKAEERREDSQEDFRYCFRLHLDIDPPLKIINK